MKKIRLVLLAIMAMGLGANAQENSVLFQVGDVVVTADEFTAVYEKNKGVGLMSSRDDKLTFSRQGQSYLLPRLV